MGQPLARPFLYVPLFNADGAPGTGDVVPFQMGTPRLRVGTACL